ncbi:tetratricopeptide repeat protein 23-like [Discoglossus pictus]
MVRDWKTMQSTPIYIPTDATYSGLGSQCTTPKTTCAAPDETYNDEDSILNYSEGFLTLPTERSIYSENVSSPWEKLLKAQRMAENFIKQNEVIRANKELIRCVAFARIVHGDGHWKLAQAFANLAHGYLTLRALPAQARQHAESAKNILLRGVDMAKSAEEKREILETLITIYYTLGMAHLLQNKYPLELPSFLKPHPYGRSFLLPVEAYLNLQKVEKIVEEMDDLKERRAVTSKISEMDISIALGKACLQQNKLSLATNYFDQAVNLITSSEGDSSPELIHLYQDMAKTEQMRKKHDRAIEHLLQAHSICQTTYTNLSIQAAQTGLLLAKAYVAPGTHDYNDAAEKYFRESLSVYEAILGPEDLQTLGTCVEFSKWLIQIGNKEESFKLLRRAVSSETEFSETAAEIYSLMASVRLSDGKILKAYKLFKKCLETQTAVYGSQHNKTKGTQSILHALQKSGGVGV